MAQPKGRGMAQFEPSQVVLVDLGDGLTTSGIVVEATDGQITVLFPDLSDVPSHGDAVELRFFDEKGRHTGATKIVSWQGTPDVRATVAIPRSVKSIQDRAFFRVRVALTVDITATSSDGKRLRDEHARTQDISAGGVRVVTRIVVAAGDNVMVAIRTPWSAEIALVLPAQVVRTMPTAADPKKHLVAFEFRPRRERERDQLVRLMFDLQLDRHLMKR